MNSNLCACLLGLLFSQLTALTVVVGFTSGSTFQTNNAESCDNQCPYRGSGRKI